MQPVFVDAVAWIALINTSDTYARQTRSSFLDLNRRRVPLLTTEFIFVEVADALSSPAFRSDTVSYLDQLRSLPQLEIIPASSELVAKGWTLYRRRADKGWSLTDCISFVVMHDRGIREAFTADHHFEQARFQKLL